MACRRWRWWGSLVLVLTLLAGCQALTPKVAGQVLDAETGQPVGNAEIQAAGAVYETDQDGRFALYLGAGDFDLTFASPAHAPQAIAVTLTRTRLLKRVNVSLTPRMLSLTARDALTGAPVAGVTAHWGAQTSETDAQGQTILRLAADEPLTLTGTGYRDLTADAAQLSAALAVGAVETAFAVELAPRNLAGYVRDAVTGESVAGATVKLGEQTVTSDAQGAYALAHLPPTGELTVTAPGYRGPATLPYAGEEQADITIQPWLAAVTVLDADSGAPVPETVVAAGAAQAVTDAQGLAQVRAEPGAELRLTAEGYHEATAAFAGESLTVTIKPSRLVVVLTNSATQEPLAKARVIAYPAEGEPTILYSDERGHVDILDALQYERLLVKQAGYERVEAPIERMGRLELAVAPFEARGIYISFAYLAVPDRLTALLDMVAENDLNMVTVDIKGDKSLIAWDSPNPVAREVGAFAMDDLLPLPELLKMCHDRGIYVVARMVVFKDDNLAAKKPEWAVKNADGTLYKDWEGLHWVDPFRQGVRDYIVALAVEAAEMGFDEVQFDYVRFPSDGNTKYLEYEKEAVFDNRTVLMAEFFQQAGAALAPTPAFLSADIFGLVVWMGSDRDMGIGQRVEDIAPYVDYICPMLYPQTFASGNLGYANPELYPYELVFRSVRKAKTLTDTAVRPWLQHYSGTVAYDLPELVRQRKGAEDALSNGWTFWNAGGKYNTALFGPDPYAQLPGLPTPDDVD